MSTEKKPRKMKIGSVAWERMANELARSVSDIGACKACHAPCLVGYVCHHCGIDKGTYSESDF